MSSRIHRGFHRIGVVLAVPPLLLAGWLAGQEAWLQRVTVDPYAEFADAPPIQPAVTPNRYDAPGMSVPAPWVEHRPYYRADYTGSGLSLAVALALYSAARAVGWVLDGFLTPRRDP